MISRPTRRTRPGSAALLLAATFLCATGAAQAPPGYKSFDHKATGLRFYHPKKFKPVPAQPTEKLIIARFTRTSPYLARRNDRRRSPGTLSIFVLQNKTTPAGGEAAEPETAPTSYDDVIKQRNSIHFYKEFMESRFKGWRLKLVEKDDEDRVKEFELARGGTRRGYLWVKETSGQTWGVVGFCDKKVYDAMVKRFRRVARSLHEPKGYGSVKDDSERFYRGKDFRGIPFRVEARRQMIKGWKPHDTENFFIVYHTKNKGMLKKVANDLEAIRPLYIKYFPPVKPIEAVSVVRICRDRQEYHKYGGPRGSAGYWNPVAKELVLYDFEYLPPNAGTNVRSRNAADSYIVLYHEAFHQYIYYAAGEVAPHDWFNEGLGDFFSGTVIYRNSRKIKGVNLNRWRIDLVKAKVGSSAFIPLEELLNANRPKFYNRRVIGLMYAEAWSFCYFLLKSETGQENQKWRRIIPAYFDALKEGNAKHVGALGDDVPLAERRKAQLTARVEALKTALTGVDLGELEDAWTSWIEKTKDPWARFRKHR